MRFIVWGVIPLGNLAGGALASLYGLRTAIWVGAIGSCLAALPVLLSPVRSVVRVPEPAEAAAAGDEALVGPGLAPPPVDDRV